MFWPQAVESDEFPASFDKSMGLTPRPRQIPKGYVFPLALNVTIGFRPLTGKLNLRERDNNNWGK